MATNRKKLASARKRATNTPAANPFGNLQGERHGGRNVLMMEPGEVRGPFTHDRIDTGVKLDPTLDPVDVFVAKDENGVDVRMPASQIFRNCATAANLNKGDQYHVARLDDAKKKSGKGKGNPMAVYEILVTSRA